MGLNIIISSAVELKEKDRVVAKLNELQERHLLKIDEIYDCNKHASFWGSEAKQTYINRFIDNADWFICLAPHYAVGLATWKELEHVIKRKQNGSPIAITVFHPLDLPEEEKEQIDPKRQISFDEMKKRAQELLKTQEEQYYEGYTGGADGLIKKLEDIYVVEYNQNQTFWSQHIGYYTQPGKDVEASKLFFDEKRASKEWGFIDGSENYIWRNSVDGKLKQKLDNFAVRFLFITGKPTSGKSRALYECLHSTLQDKNVVVMKSDNIVNICRNLEIEIKQRGKDIDLPRRFEDNEYFFVCDQIDDVFKQARVPDELRLSFLRNISEQDNCKLIATGTRKSLDSFVEESDRLISQFGNLNYDGNSDIITIPSLSSDVDSQEILAQLRKKYPFTEGETIGDFIKELKSQKIKIVNKLYEKARTNEYIPQLLKSIQLILAYRNNHSLLLPICVLRKFFPEASSSEFKKKTIECLDFLIGKNVIKITDTEFEEQEITRFPKNKFSESDFCITTMVDDEEYPKYISALYTFTVNELVWDYLLDSSKHDYEESLLYDLYNVEDLGNAMTKLFESYPHAPTLRRFVSRVPRQKEWLDKQGDEQRLRFAWDYAYMGLSRLDTSKEVPLELSYAYNILIGRAKDVNQVYELLELMKNRQIETNDSTIGEMYGFAIGRLTKDTPEFNSFIDKLTQLNKEQQRRDYEKGHEWGVSDFFRICRQVRLFSKNYREANASVFHSLYNLTYTNDEGKTLHGIEATSYISKQNNTIDKRSLDQLMYSLAYMCKTIEDVEKLIKCHKYFHVDFTSFTLHRIGHVVKNSKKNAAEIADCLTRILDTILPTSEARKDNPILYERIVVCFVIYIPSFQLSSRLYSRWHDEMNMGDKHNIRLVSLCLKNCKREEFQSAIAFINKIPNDAINGITYNLLISLAPNPEEAIYLVNRMKISDIDEYTLSNCLRCIDTVRQMNRRQDAKVLPHQIFIMAYEIFNHPKLQAVRTRTSCLQKLYKLVFNSYQEDYVKRIAGPQRMAMLTFNDYINATRISSQFRGFKEAWEDVYKPARDKFQELHGTFRADLFSAMCAKYFKDRKFQALPEAKQYADELNEDIQRAISGKRGSRIIQDEFFFLNYHIKFLGEPLFSDDDKQMSPVFMDWFSNKTGHYDANNLAILPRYIDYILNLQGVSGERMWQKVVTLYSVYKEHFAQIKRDFRPDDSAFVFMFRVVEKCADKKDCLAFIDQELDACYVERSIRLHYYLRDNAHLYEFNYDKSHPQLYNRQIENIACIQNAGNTQQILDIFQQEIKLEGFVTISLINCALKKYREFQAAHTKTIRAFVHYVEETLPKNGKVVNLSQMVANFRRTKSIKASGESGKLLKRMQMYTLRASDIISLTKELNALSIQLDDEQLKEMLDFIKTYNLFPSITFKGLTYLTLLTKDKQERVAWLKDLEKSVDISDYSYALLASEKVIAQTGISYSRRYLKKSLGIFEDVYGDIPTTAANMPEEKWKMLGMHLRNETTVLSSMRKRAHLTAPEQLDEFFTYLKNEGQLEILEIISTILQYYQVKPEFSQPQNFSTIITLSDVIHLLSLFDGKTSYWNDLYKKLTSVCPQL